MSSSIMARVWAVPEITSTQKLVLLALADSANDHGLCAAPIDRIARKCSLPEQAVVRCIADLCELELLSNYDGRSYQFGEGLA